MVDLIEGAPELVVMGATDDQLARIDESDGALRSIARHGAGTAGIGLGLTTALAGLASWGALTFGVHATHGGSLNGALLATLALVPLAAFELVSPLPAATQALQRSRVAAGRVFATIDAPSRRRRPRHPGFPSATARTRWPCVMCGRPTPVPDGRRCAASTWICGRAAAWHWSGPAEPGSPRSPTCSSASFPPTPERPRWTALPSSAWRPTTFVGSWVWSSSAPTSSTPRWPRTSASAGVRPPTTELTDVLVRVGLGDWLAGLPRGLATEVGRKAARLSGGQRQRVAVARALLADFPILVLDEPAEHLDPAAADALTADLLALTEGRSTLFISHRLVGLERVDEIVVLDAGQVIERGTHTDLLTAGGRYAGLWWEERMNDRPILDEPSSTPASRPGQRAAITEGSDPP